MIISKKDIGSTLNKAYKHDADNDAIYLAREANIVKRHVYYNFKMIKINLMVHLKANVRKNLCQFLFWL